MKRFAALTAVALVLLYAPGALADDVDGHPSGSLGFHTVDAPVGVRCWFPGQQVALDLGLGFQSHPSNLFTDETLKDFTIDVGVPVLLKTWSRVHFLFRPGFQFRSEEEETTSPPAAFDTDKVKIFQVSGELETEIFLVDNVTISAAHGIAYQSINPIGAGDNLNTFTTTGGNFTSVGFHVYFFGGPGM